MSLGLICAANVLYHKVPGQQVPTVSSTTKISPESQQHENPKPSTSSEYDVGISIDYK